MIVSRRYAGSMQYYTWNAGDFSYFIRQMDYVDIDTEIIYYRLY